MILRFKTLVSAMLKDYPDVRATFNEETINMEKELRDHISNKCFYTILATSFLVALLYAGIFSIMHDTRKANILQYIGDFTK